MTPYELRPLKQALRDSYGHFADQRIKKIDNGHFFIVDDRTGGDHGADCKLFSWFCLIFADVVGPESLKVTMRGGAPRSAGVTGWIKKNKAKSSDHGLEFSITKKNLSELRALAEAFRAIVKPGARYSVRAYKYVCPRAANSLEKLHSVLLAHRKQ